MAVRGAAGPSDEMRRFAIPYGGPEEGGREAREYFSKQERVTYRMTIERVSASGLK